MIEQRESNSVCGSRGLQIPAGSIERNDDWSNWFVRFGAVSIAPGPLFVVGIRISEGYEPLLQGFRLRISYDFRSRSVEL